MNKRYYKGILCKTCNVPVTTGSKLGFCRKCRPTPNHSEESKKRLSESHKGSKNPNFGKPAWNRGIPMNLDLKNRLIKIHTGKKYSIEHRKKLSELRRGNKHPNWQGGITSINKTIRHSLEYKLWRESVFKRDNWVCIWCGQKGGELHADHIKPFAYYPELRFAIDNGRTLCIECHKKTDTYLRKK